MLANNNYMMKEITTTWWRK